MKQRTPNLKREEGFTIAEIVVAIFLLTIGLMSLAGVSATVAKRQRYSQAVTTLTNLSATTLEEIKATAYDDIASKTEAYGAISNFPAYKRELIVTPNADDTLKVVEVKVTAKNGQVISLETVVAR